MMNISLMPRLEEDEDPDLSRRLHVSNIPFRFRETDLCRLFSKAGVVTDVEIIFNEKGSKGFGFVTMASDESATWAKYWLNGIEVEGRRIEVNRANRRVQTKPKIPLAPMERSRDSIIYWKQCGGGAISPPSRMQSNNAPAEISQQASPNNRCLVRMFPNTANCFAASGGGIPSSPPPANQQRIQMPPQQLPPVDDRRTVGSPIRRNVAAASSNADDLALVAWLLRHKLALLKELIVETSSDIARAQRPSADLLGPVGINRSTPPPQIYNRPPPAVLPTRYFASSSANNSVYSSPPSRWPLNSTSFVSI